VSQDWAEEKVREIGPEIRKHLFVSRCGAGIRVAPGLSWEADTVIAQALREAYERGATDMRTAAALAAAGAGLPEGYQWGRDAMLQFDFGKFRAQLAIEALPSSPMEPTK
jgi:hypothetical protein